jgi:hypothetical protein
MHQMPKPLLRAGFVAGDGNALNVQKEIPYGVEGKLFVWRDTLRNRLSGYADRALPLSDLS